MKKYLFLLIVLLQYSNSLWSQPCPVGLPYVLQFLTQDVTTGQSFTPSCSGQLKTINLSFASLGEDLRGTPWCIRCNIKTASNTLIATGIMPNGKDTTNDVYPLQTLNVDFNCSNVMLTAGTQYIWEVVVITQDPIGWPLPLPGLALFSRSNTSLLAGGNYINDGLQVSTQDIRGFNVTIDTPNPTLTATQSQTNPSCGICTDGSASVVASGGTGAYTYSWLPSGGSAASATNLSNGTYTCTITSCGQSIVKTFILSNSATIAQGWTQIGLDIDGNQNGRFGWSVSMPDSLTVAIGAPNRTQGSDFFTGQVKIYRRTGNTWIQKGADLNGFPFNSSGQSVSMPDSSTIAIAGKADTVQIFNWNGTAWVQKGLNIVGEAFNDSFGNSVSMPNANTVAIGAPGNDANGNASGHTRIYIWDGSSWIQKGSDIDGEAAVDQSGYSVSMPDINTVAISANENDGNGSNAGHVRIYSWIGSAWVQKGIDIDGENADDKSGFSVSMPDSNTVAIGAPANGNVGHIRIYSWNGSAWVQKGIDIEGENASDGFGYSLSMPDVNTVAIGATGNDANGSNAGTTSIYSWNGNSWIKRGINLNGENALSQFGWFVSMPNSKTVAIGAPFHDSENGMVRIFDLNCPLIDTTLTITACESYTWPLNGLTYTSSTNLPSVTLMTSNGCDSIVNLNLTIVNPTIPLSGTTLITPINCFGQTNGAIDLTPSGGTSPYTFNWGGGITTEDRAGIAVGNYSVIITDAGFCKDTIDVTITQPTALTSSVSSQTNVGCNGAATGAATVLAGGGTAPYTYSWSPTGGTAVTATGLAAGTYTCTITDANSCTKTQNVTITQPTAITSSVSSQTNVSCNGGTNGSATVLAGAGTAPYTYSWSPSGGTAATASSLAQGTYTCTITDANSCTKTQNVTITQPTALSATAVITNVSCNAGTNGAIDVSVSGGISPYTYSWGAGVTTQDRTGLSAGTYLDTVTDANGCQAFASYTITEPTAITSSVASQTNVLCNGALTGAATVSASGGTGAYTYSWSPSGGTAATATALAAGTYTVTITDSNSCTKTQNVTITQSAALTSSVSSQTNVGCNGASTGAATVLAGGGTAPYTYSWSPSGGTAATASALVAGTYTCTITDANLCTKTQNVTITQPASGISSSVASQTNILCNGASTGKAKISVSGGTAPYTYSWTGSSSTADSIVSMAAGTYTCTITDANSCTKTQAVTITQAIAISATAVITNVSCNTGTNGAIDVTVSGGTSPYTYSWGSGITTQDRTGLSIGTYIDTIIDANACQSILNFTITQPTAITSSVVAQTNILCNGSATGAATVSASGGTGSYSYSWSPSGGTAATATGLAAGLYTVTITDANSCTKTQTATITQLTGIGYTSSTTNVSCFGGNNGAINITASGGTAPYTYNWGGGITSEDRTGLSSGSYNLTITDANSCSASYILNVTQPTQLTSSIAITNASCFAASDGALDITVTGGTAPYGYFWISSLTSEDLTSRSTGMYWVEIADANGCLLNDTAVITQPTEIISNSIITNVGCNGDSTGAINIVPSGGVGPYTYNWGGGITTEDRTGLSDGSYSIAITDATSCVSNISVTVSEPNVLSATNSAVNVACFGASTGSIDLTVSGGTAPYTYNWGGGLTSQDLTNLPSGNYTVSVTDDHGCTTTSNATLTQPTDISVVKDSMNILCFGDNSGMAEVTVSGGVAPYSYTWTGTSAFDTIANFLTAGNYSVQITDANGCSKVAAFALTQNLAITSSFTITQCDPYTWESGFYPNSGTYQQVFTAVNGCDSMVTLSLTVLGYPTLNITSSETIICAGEDVTLNATGGVATATWDNGVINNQAFAPSTTTIYTASISNAQGCITSESIEIFVRELPFVLMDAFPDSSCIDANIIACPFSTPAGGTYIGTGVSGVLLNTQTAGLGQHEVIYTFTDQFGCTNSDTSIVNIVECELPENETGIEDLETILISIYPNPTSGDFTIESDKETTVMITDALGKHLQSIDLQAGENKVSLSNEATGIYFVILNSNRSIFRISKN